MYLYKFPNLYYFWKPGGEISGNRACFWKLSLKNPLRVPFRGGIGI
nr:MAG TPA: Urotensin II [Caudoviricetes sp.]